MQPAQTQKGGDAGWRMEEAEEEEEEVTLV